MELRRKFSSRLPATPCTPEMRQAVEELALKENCDMSEIHRAALSLFLLKYGTESTNFDTETVKEQAS